MRPLEGRDIDPGALNAIGLSEDTIWRYPKPRKGIMDFSRWIRSTYHGKRVPVWSDNPGFGWQFVNGYLWLYTDAPNLD